MFINQQVLIAFVVGVINSAVDAVVNTKAMVPFTAVKTVLDDYLCASYPVPMKTILSISVMQCSLECQRVSSCGGFNFRDNVIPNKCEQFSGSSNVVLNVKPGCIYFDVTDY